MRKWLPTITIVSGPILLWALSQFSWEMSWKFGVGFTLGAMSVYGAWFLQQSLEMRIFGRNLHRVGKLLEEDLKRLEAMTDDPIIAKGVSQDRDVQAKFQELTNLIHDKQLTQLETLKQK